METTMCLSPRGSGGIALPTAPGLPPQSAKDLEAFVGRLRSGTLLDGLRYLNSRTPHRFTAVLRFDGDMLRSVAMVDKWLPEVERGDDIPLSQAYCAHLYTTGQPLLVEDGRTDPRTPWMADSPTVSYCGSMIRDTAGTPWGAICHFDPAPCDAKASDVPLLEAAAAVIYRAATTGFP